MTPGVSRAARLRAYLAGVVVTAGLCGVAYRAWALQVDEGVADLLDARLQQRDGMAFLVDLQRDDADGLDDLGVGQVIEGIAALGGGAPQFAERITN